MEKKVANKMKKVMPMLVLALTFAVTGCKKDYLEGFGAGETQGYNNGYGDGQTDGYASGHAAGYTEGWDKAKAYFASADYLAGFADGKNEGLTIGYNNGYSAGNTDGLAAGYNNGYSDGHLDGSTTGYNSGYGDGFSDGETQGYNTGYGDGHIDGQVSGYNNGYDDGHADGFAAGTDPVAIQTAYNQGYGDGYDDGYDDGFFDGDAAGFNTGYNTGFNDGNVIGFNDGYNLGFDDGYDLGIVDGYNLGFDDGYDLGYYDGINGFSNPDTFVAAKDLDGLPNNSAVGLNKYVKLTSITLNDLVNFKQMKTLEKAYLDGFKASSNILEETAAGSKDLAKLATARENFRVAELSRQIRTEYSLSADRSDKVAKLATSFRKLANTRAITESDAEAFSTELLGVSVKKIENAYKKTLKGEMGELKTVVQASAEANDISELKATQLMLKLFL